MQLQICIATYFNINTYKKVDISLRSFQLEVVKITKDQEDRYLRNVLEQEKLQTEQYIQQEKVLLLKKRHFIKGT